MTKLESKRKVTYSLVLWARFNSFLMLAIEESSFAMKSLAEFSSSIEETTEEDLEDWNWNVSFETNFISFIKSNNPWMKNRVYRKCDLHMQYFALNQVDCFSHLLAREPMNCPQVQEYIKIHVKRDCQMPIIYLSS